MRIGIFGGSFNPIHKGHVKIVNKVLEKGLVDKVLVIPCGNHPYGKSLAEPEKRIKMIQLSFRDNPLVEVSRIEVDSSEKSYMVTTIDKLKDQFPKDEFFIICGGDVLNDFPKWYKAEKIAKEVEFIIYLRKGIDKKNNDLMKIRAFLTEDICDTSSSEIRKRVKENKPISDLVPVETEEIIRNIYIVY